MNYKLSLKIALASTLSLGLVGTTYGDSIGDLVRNHARKSFQIASTTALTFQQQLADKLLELQKNSKNGLIEIQMGETASEYKFDMIDSSNYRSASYASSNNKNYQIALANAFNIATKASGLAVLSVGFKQSDRGAASGKAGGLIQTMHAYDGRIEGFVLVGTTENTIAEAAAINNHLLTLSKGLDVMNDYYNQLLNDLITTHSKRLIKKGIKENSKQFFEELNKLLEASQIKYSFTMINSSEDQKRFMESLKEFSDGVDKERKSMEDKRDNHRMSEFGSLGVYIAELLNNYRSTAANSGRYETGRIGCYSVAGTPGSIAQCRMMNTYDLCTRTAGCSWGYIPNN